MFDQHAIGGGDPGQQRARSAGVGGETASRAGHDHGTRRQGPLGMFVEHRQLSLTIAQAPLELGIDRRLEHDRRTARDQQAADQLQGVARRQGHQYFIGIGVDAAHR